MRMSGYPLEIVHEYEIEARDALDATAFVSRQSKGLAGTVIRGHLTPSPRDTAARGRSSSKG